MSRYIEISKDPKKTYILKPDKVFVDFRFQDNGFPKVKRFSIQKQQNIGTAMAILCKKMGFQRQNTGFYWKDQKLIGREIAEIYENQTIDVVSSKLLFFMIKNRFQEIKMIWSICIAIAKVKTELDVENSLIHKKIENESVPLVLDYNADSNTNTIYVDKGIATLLKPHQVEGIKFMFDVCFESSDRLTESIGKGCILAHSMGLGM